MWDIGIDTVTNFNSYNPDSQAYTARGLKLSKNKVSYEKVLLFVYILKSTGYICRHSV